VVGPGGQNTNNAKKAPPISHRTSEVQRELFYKTGLKQIVLLVQVIYHAVNMARISIEAVLTREVRVELTLKHVHNV
jgi:hypothetical protein